VVDKIRNRGSGKTQLFEQWLQEFRLTDREEKFADCIGAGRRLTDVLGPVAFADTTALLNRSWDGGAKILVEGTQGTLLDLHLGPYPYTTHKQTQCGNWIAECGLSPSLPYEVVLVVRSYPIRVAGNSGPMPREISWVDLARRINGRLEAHGLPPRVRESSLRQFESACQHVAGMSDPPRNWKIENWPQEIREKNPEFVSELHKAALEQLETEVVDDLRNLFELTTVTKKLRRIAELDRDTLKRSVQMNRPAYIVLTFANYLFPEMWGWGQDEFDGLDRRNGESFDNLFTYASELEADTGTEVRWCTLGPEDKHFVDVLGRTNGQYPMHFTGTENEVNG